MEEKGNRQSENVDKHFPMEMGAELFFFFFLISYKFFLIIIVEDILCK